MEPLIALAALLATEARVPAIDTEPFGRITCLSEAAVIVVHEPIGNQPAPRRPRYDPIGVGDQRLTPLRRPNLLGQLFPVAAVVVGEVPQGDDAAQVLDRTRPRIH